MAKASKRRGKGAGRPPATQGTPSPTKADLAAENAALRRALGREVARGKRQAKQLDQETRRSAGLEMALGEARAHERAATGVLRLIGRSPGDAQPVFDAIARQAMTLCDAAFAVVVRYDGQLLLPGGLAHLTSEGMKEMAARMPMRADRSIIAGRAVLDRAVVHVPDVDADPEYDPGFKAALRAASGLGVPMLLEGEAVGAIMVGRVERRPFSGAQIALLQTFADQAVIAIENVRLFTELDARNADLAESLEQQTATSEVLRAISGSPTDVQPVLDIIAHNATRVCAARDGAVLLMDGADLRVAAHHGPLSVGSLGSRAPIGRDWVSGRAVVDRCAIQVEDLLAAGDDYPRGLEMARLDGHRTTLVTPLLREGEPIGVLLIRRGEVRLFTPKQMSLLETFAAQAVIAIENVRLFTELREKNHALTEAHAQVSESLEQQTATSEILRVISSSPTDVQPVFDTIVASATRLCSGLFSAVYRYDGELIHLVAHHNFSPTALAAARRTFPMPPSQGGATARAVLARDVVHIPDLRLDPEYAHQVMARDVGFPSLLAVPMLREGMPIGAITVAGAGGAPFRTSRSPCSEPSPTRR